MVAFSESNSILGVNKKVHWTQRPENKEKLRQVGKLRWKVRKAKEGVKVKKVKRVRQPEVEVSPFIQEIESLITRAKARVEEIDATIQKLTAERESILSILK